MFAVIRQWAAIGAAVAGVGWLTVGSPAAAGARPLPIPLDNGSICPSGPGVRYMLDPNNSDDYYVCKGGVQQDHKACPPGTHPDVSIKPVDCPSDQGFEGKP